jgi:hypothetical protein
VSVCAEALVHEAIHQHLYRLEIANGAFCDLADEGRYRSPWSGNRIPLHSLIHASLVWYGVLGLWCQLAQTVTSLPEAAAARQRVAETLFGFAFIRETIEAPGFPRARVAPGIAELIGHIAGVTAAARLRRRRAPRWPRSCTRARKAPGSAISARGLRRMQSDWRRLIVTTTDHSVHGHEWNAKRSRRRSPAFSAGSCTTSVHDRASGGPTIYSVQRNVDLQWSLCN